MSRSVWKVPYISPIFFSNYFRKSRKSVFFSWSRNSLISKAFVGRNLTIHNGIWPLTVKVGAKMIGFKLGEFSHTKRLGDEIHTEKKAKKKKKQ